MGSYTVTEIATIIFLLTFPVAAFTASPVVILVQWVAALVAAIAMIAKK